MPAELPGCIIIITVDRTEIWLSPRDTDPDRAASLRVHRHGRAESQVLPLHVTRAGLLDARIVVLAGVHLAVAVPERAVPDELTLPHSPGFTVGVGVARESLSYCVRTFLACFPAVSKFQGSSCD